MLKQESIPTIEAPVPLTHTSNDKGDKYMKLHRFYFTFFVLICLLIPLTATAQPVDIPDPNLRAKIETALNKQAGDPITAEEMETLTSLIGNDANISDLTGLKHATNLTSLRLDDNGISDISALAGLTNLTSLGLDNNSISDISGLSGLTNLTSLGLGSNAISDIAVLSGLTNLTALNLTFNLISDISALAGLTHLTDLNLRDNAISDISALAGLTHLTDLNLVGNPISDISGLSGLTNLTWLGLGSNSISDISVLSGLTKLTSLHLYSISDISVLSGLTNLTTLVLVHNSISDISVLSGLTNLTTLALVYNSISDISVLSGLTNLTGLDLMVNSISDISALAGLTHLTQLGLMDNSISDISALEGLTNLTDLNLRDNPLSYPSIYTHIPTLQSRGVTVEFDNRVPATLQKISGTITESNNVLIVEVRDSKERPFAAVPVTFTVTSGGGTLSVTSTTTNENGQAESTFTLGKDGEPNMVSASVEGISETITFSDVPEPTVDIPDPNLRAAIEKELNKQAGDPPITAADMVTLTSLSASDSNISDLTGLEHATNLGYLSLQGGSDISPLSGLTNLEYLSVTSGSISDISPLSDLTNLTFLQLLGNSISDISPLSGLTNLTGLNLSSNSISDISVLSGLTNLTDLDLPFNSISDISVLSSLTNLTALDLRGLSISDISALSGLTNLTQLELNQNSISDISALSGLTNLTWLNLRGNSISDISALSGLTNLTDLILWWNSISDISALSGLTNLTWLFLGGNQISDISALSGLTNLTHLILDLNNISDISALSGLTNLTSLSLSNILDGALYDGNEVKDISSVVGLTNLIDLNLLGNPLSYPSLHTHIPTLQSRGVEVRFDDTPPTAIEFDLSVPSGISLIHIPLKVTAVDGVSKTIESVGDLYDALGGAANVSVLITYNTQTQRWNSYLGDRYRGRPGDRTLTDDLGIIASMKTSASVRLSGDALGTNGSSSITLQKGLNLVGVPLKVPKIAKVSDLFALEGVKDNVSVIIVSDNGFKVVARPGDAGDVELTGGQSFILTAQSAATVPITGDGWANAPGITAAPPMALPSIQVKESTPILAVTGSIVDEASGLDNAGLRVTVKNLSTGKVGTAISDDDSVGYQVTFVELETGRAAQIGDTLEVSIQSPNPLIGVHPLRHIVTAEDVKRGHIQLAELVAYEIPAQTELLLNYPNPFNPETWIPYHLAHATDVTLTIYDTKGALVRRLELGHQQAGFYTDRAKAAHWDGRNEQGESVASGVYFYQLRAGDYKALRRMAILK